MLFRGVVQMQHGRSECLSEEFLNLMNHRLSRGGGWIRGGVTDVDEQEPSPLRPQQVAISERSDRRRMGTGRTADPAGQDWRWQAHSDHAGGGERPDVHSLDRLSVARDPERPTAEKLGLRLLRSVDI